MSDYAFDPLIWANYPIWTLYEIAYLSAGVDPEQASGDLSYPISAEQEELILKNQRKLDRFKRHPELRNGLAPWEALERFGKVGIEFPSELTDAVVAAAVDTVQVPANSAPNNPRTSSITRQLNKCRTMLLVLAIEKLGCDPRKGCKDSGKEISAIAERLGITIDEDTATTHLAEAWSGMKAAEIEAVRQALGRAR